MRGLQALASAGFLLLTSSAYAEEAKKGMPQLDLANPLTTSQVIWLAVIFLALYLLLSKWGLPQVATVLETRAKTIADDLDAARLAKTLADTAHTEMLTATHKAQAEAQAEVTAAVDAAKAQAARKAAEANADMERRLAQAEIRIASARDASVGALREVSLAATSDVVTRLAGFTPSQATIDHAVDHAIAARAA
jgi:F-type H+-transporting ATPase subunit b